MRGFTYSEVCLPNFWVITVSARLRYSVAPCRRNFGWRSLNEFVRPTFAVGGEVFVSDSSELALSTMLAARESTSKGDSGSAGECGLDISITWKNLSSLFYLLQN